MKLRKSAVFSLLLFAFAILSCSNELSDFERGKIFMKLGDYNNAAKSFELAVWNKPEDAERHYYLGEALMNSEVNGYYSRSERKRAKEFQQEKTYQQFLISAKIGSEDVSEKFSRKAWEWYKTRHYYRGIGKFARLAIIAYEENPRAQFLYGIQNGYEGLPFLRDALDLSSDDSIVAKTFEYLNSNQEFLTNGFLERLTTAEDGFEEFGPAVFSPLQNEIVWCRVKKNSRGRYKSQNIKLYRRILSDTLSFSLTTLGTSIAFPVCSADSVMIYYSKKNRIYRFNRKNKKTTALSKGAFVSVNKTGNKLTFSKNWQVFVSDTSGQNVKQITKARRYEYNFMPKFVHPMDNQIVVLKYFQNTGNLYFYKIDTSGQAETKISKISRYGVDFDRPWRNQYDISPDGSKLVFAINNRLYMIDVNSGKEDTLHISGDYPTFSPDGKKLLILTRKFGKSGQLALVDLQKVFEANTFFKKGQANRKKMLRLLERCTKNMEKEKLE